ncbi:MAG TPA: peptide ABC transporter substrate-binding protein [Pseudomonadales bacterium]|nr:peptide ABC transporter substrate-binding protein [Pseudomonadales bacterium]
MVDDLFEGLTAFGADGQPGPGVASSWETSENGLIWIFHLRPDARWSNGEPLTAENFVYGWRRTVDPKTAAAYAQAVAPVLNAYEIATGKRPVSDLGVTAVDAHTLRVELSEPAPYLPFLMTNAWMYPLYRPAIERHGDAWTRVGNIVTNGPFRLVENVIGNRIALEKNPAYWDAANVRLTGVDYLILEDRNAQSQRFMADQVQFVDAVQATDLPWLRERLGSEVVIEPYFGTFMIGINDLEGPFRGNRKLRLALSVAIDRDKLAKYVLNGAGFPAYSLMPPLDGYQQQIPDWAKLSTKDRHALARRLYQEAGYSEQKPLRAGHRQWRPGLIAVLRGAVRHVAYRARRRGQHPHAGIQGAVAEQPPAPEHAVSQRVDRRLPRPLHLPAALQDRFRPELRRLFTPRIRRAARSCRCDARSQRTLPHL